MKTLIDLTTEALSAGDEKRPAALIQTVEDLKQPSEVLTSLDLPRELFDALEVDAPGCGKLRDGTKTIADTEFSDALRLLRWVLRELSQWSATADANGAVMGAIFCVLEMLGFRKEHWSLLPDDRTANAELRGWLVQFLNSTVITMSAGPGRRMAYEQSIVEKVVRSDEQQNWVVLAENWRFISGFLQGSLLLRQGVLYLARHYPDALRDVVDRQSQMSVAWLIAKQLPIQFRFRLARESTSQRFQFAALLSVEWHELDNRQLPEGAPEELTQLLVQVAQNPEQWRSWMKVFNEHPVRFPWLQVSLGKALAQVPEEAIKGYVDAISLYPWTFGLSLHAGSSQANDRSCVGICLQQFRADASEACRKTLWARAHEKWLTWNFGGAEQTLMGICYSELDYALVGHALENLTAEERSARIAANLSRVTHMEDEWHASYTNLLDVRNRLLSQIQPHLIAEQTPHDTWLSESPHLPQGCNGTEYSRRRFSV